MTDKKVTYSDGDEFEINGRKFRVNFPYDDCSDEPWHRNDGHGPVSDWETRDKRPGEWVLNTDHGAKRFYDAQGAQAIALRDGWGLSDDDKAELVARLAQARTVRRRYPGGAVVVSEIAGRDPAKPLTRREIAAEAVRRDFEYLRTWCNDQWSYVGVVVTHVASGNEDSVWGIESDATEYLAETAHELADQIAKDLPPVPDGWDCVEFNIAGCYLPALINGDQSGMTSQESREFSAWLRGALHGLPPGHWDCEKDDDKKPGFCECDVSGLKADCELVRYVYMIAKGE